MNEQERNVFLHKEVTKRYDYLVENGYNVIAVFLQGSQNYELDLYDKDYKSDVDVKAIVVPTLQDIVLNHKPISTTIVLENNEHIEVKDIRVMIEMFIKQNISYIELLYTKYKKVNPEYKVFIDNLLNIRDEISNINKNQFLRCIKGMSMEKLKALEHPYPNTIDKIKKFGYDPKQLHHIVRLNEFVYRYLIEKEKLENCYISKNKKELIDIKKGKYNLEDARTLALTFDNGTKELCDLYIEKEDKINNETIDKLKKINCDIIEFSLKKELLSKRVDYISVKEVKAPFKTIKDKSIRMTIEDYKKDIKDETMCDYCIYENIVINNIYE